MSYTGISPIAVSVQSLMLSTSAKSSTIDMTPLRDSSGRCWTTLPTVQRSAVLTCDTEGYGYPRLSRGRRQGKAQPQTAAHSDAPGAEAHIEDAESGRHVADSPDVQAICSAYAYAVTACGRVPSCLTGFNLICNGEEVR